MSDNIASVFGSQFLSTLLPVNFVTTLLPTASAEPEHSADKNDSDIDDDTEVVSSVTLPEGETAVNLGDDEGDAVRVRGFISRVGAGVGVGRSDNDRQFVFCNGRPVDMPKLTKLLNEVSIHHTLLYFTMSLITLPLLIVLATI